MALVRAPFASAPASIPLSALQTEGLEEFPALAVGRQRLAATQLGEFLALRVQGQWASREQPLSARRLASSNRLFRAASRRPAWRFPLPRPSRAPAACCGAHTAQSPKQVLQPQRVRTKRGRAGPKATFRSFGTTWIAFLLPVFLILERVAAGILHFVASLLVEVTPLPLRR